jgi:hypothetical protein
VVALLKHDAKVSAREEKYHGTPASWANYAGHTEARDLILQGPVDIMEAMENGLAERVEAILEQDPAALNRPFRDYPVCPLNAEGWFTPLALQSSVAARKWCGCCWTTAQTARFARLMAERCGRSPKVAVMHESSNVGVKKMQ